MLDEVNQAQRHCVEDDKHRTAILAREYLVSHGYSCKMWFNVYVCVYLCVPYAGGSSSDSRRQI